MTGKTEMFQKKGMKYTCVPILCPVMICAQCRNRRGGKLTVKFAIYGIGINHANSACGSPIDECMRYLDTQTTESIGEVKKWSSVGPAMKRKY